MKGEKRGKGKEWRTDGRKKGEESEEEDRIRTSMPMKTNPNNRLEELNTLGPCDVVDAAVVVALAVAVDVVETVLDMLVVALLSENVM